MLDTYLSLCTEYYDLDKPICNKSELDFYLQYCKKANGPILEPMCGTGRFLLPILERGFDAYGFDASQFMLEQLKLKAKAIGLQPNCWQGYLEDLDHGSKYDLVFIPSGSFCLILDLISVKNSLKRIHSSLAKDGIFVFEVETLKSLSKQENVWHGSVKKRENGQLLILNTLQLPPANNIVPTLCRYEILEGSQVIRSENEYFQVRFYNSKEIGILLKEVGFKEIKFIKPYESNIEIEGSDEYFICECRK